MTLGEKTGTSSQYADFNVSLFFPFAPLGFLLALIMQGRGDFSGGPVVKTLCLQGRGSGSILGWGTKIPPAMWHGKKKTPFFLKKNAVG